MLQPFVQHYERITSGTEVQAVPDSRLSVMLSYDTLREHNLDPSKLCCMDISLCSRSIGRPEPILYASSLSYRQW